jgi:thiol:disulfide interchange protein DsbA
MRRHAAALLGLLLVTLGWHAGAAEAFQEGKNYFLIQPAQRTSVPPGKVEVTEVFSYGCPACNQFQPFADDLKKRLPANAVLTYLPASFIPTEQWPMFQRAYLAAQSMGIADKTHRAMFSAIWTSGELAVVNPKTNRLRTPPPSIEDAAKFYARAAGVKAEDFLATAKSFSVELNMKRADEWIKAAHVDQTPTIVVNGKYRLTVSSAGGVNQMFELVDQLVAKETR